MAKTLLLARHGKSSWNQPTQPDHERTLLDTGVERTRLVGQWLARQEIMPGLVVASHAVRALDTARLLAEALGYPPGEVQVEPGIYHQGAEGVYELLVTLPDDKDCVLLVGHNPVLTQLANLFLKEPVQYMPTTGVVGVGFDCEKWEEIPLASHKVLFLITPKMLRP